MRQYFCYEKVGQYWKCYILEKTKFVLLCPASTEKENLKIHILGVIMSFSNGSPKHFIQHTSSIVSLEKG